MGASRRGKHFGAIALKNMSVAHLGKTHSPETCRKISIAKYQTSDATRRKMRAAKLGTKQTPEHKNNTSIAIKKWWDARRVHGE
jgi:hypothetical protein